MFSYSLKFPKVAAINIIDCCGQKAGETNIMAHMLSKYHMPLINIKFSYVFSRYYI